MLKISSDPKNISSVESFVRDIFKEYKIKEDYYPNILISVTEALNNAIIHGNGMDTTKHVTIFWEYKRAVLNIKICDEGCGFCLDEIEDPTLPQNVVKIGGRGVFLIHQLSDKVRYLNQGSTIEMEFHIND